MAMCELFLKEPAWNQHWKAWAANFFGKTFSYPNPCLVQVLLVFHVDYELYIEVIRWIDKCKWKLYSNEKAEVLELLLNAAASHL